MSTDITHYKTLYISSAKNLVQILKSELAFLQEKLDSDSLERLYRSAHSLKGESFAMGYIQTGNLSKEIEYIAQAMIDKKLNINSELLEQINKSIHQLPE